MTAFPRIRKGHDFTDGEVLTPDDLDELADSATIEVSGPGKFPLRLTGSAGAGACDGEGDVNDLTGTRHRPDRLQINGKTTLVYGATVDLDFNAGKDLREISLTGNVTFTTSNREAGRALLLYLQADASARTLTFPSDWRWVTDKPATLAAAKLGTLALMCRGTTSADVVAAYTAEA